MVSTDSRSFDNWHCEADAGEPATLQMFVAATLGLFTELAPQRLSRLLDAIAECEYFHDLTMID